MSTRCGPSTFSSTSPSTSTKSGTPAQITPRRLYGSVTHTFRCLVPSLSRIELDAENLAIQSVYDLSTNQQLEFRVDDWPWITDEENQVLTVYLGSPMNFGEERKIKVMYHTEPEGMGLNWLSKEQTGTHQPFVYTDSQTYYARSVAPLQDTPSVKAPFSAKITVQKPLTALSSGFPVAQRDLGNMTEFEFNQPTPVPSYLIAVLAGVLERRAVDSRTYVYAEPETINRSAEVLSDIGTFLNIVYSLGQLRDVIDREQPYPISMGVLQRGRHALWLS